LHLVFGGEPKKLGGAEFRDLGIVVHANRPFGPDVKGSGSY
jgi:hypothetical protein